MNILRSIGRRLLLQPGHGHMPDEWLLIHINRMVHGLTMVLGNPAVTIEQLVKAIQIALSQLEEMRDDIRTNASIRHKTDSMARRAFEHMAERARRLGR